MPGTIAVILNGGRSRRMGRPKADVMVAGRPMAAWVEAALEGHEIVVAGTPIGDHRAIEDTTGVGPIAGLVTALGLDAESVFLCAVDQPWLLPGTVAALAARFDGVPVVPIDGGTRQVTCAIYPASLADRASAMALAGGSVQGLLDAVPFDAVHPEDWSAWGEDGSSWFSVDTPEDLAGGMSRFGSPGGRS
jgi:molybdopterin-guanine dinucleotide biosynthesis protein A